MACDLQVDMEGETKTYTRIDLIVEGKENRSTNDATTISPANLAGLCRGMLGSFKTKKKGGFVVGLFRLAESICGEASSPNYPADPSRAFLKIQCQYQFILSQSGEFVLKTELPYFVCHDPRRHGD